MKQVLMAGVLSRQNVVLIGAPGWGKTAVARSVAEQLTDGEFSFTRVDPSTPPEKVHGPLNPAAVLEGRLERVVEGTPYDPVVKHAIIDEIGRANDAMFDALLDTLNRLDDPDAPAVVATTNFMPAGDRQEALIDRFALWYHITPNALDVHGITKAQLSGNGRPQVDMSDFPTWDEVEEIRTMTPGPDAIKAISALLNDLTNEAKTHGRHPNPRRVTQWSHILFRVSAWYSGDDNFAVVPEQATRILRWAYPALRTEEAASWSQIAASVVDTLGAVIDEKNAEILETMNELLEADAAERANILSNIGVKMQQAGETLETIAGEDNERVQAVQDQWNDWFSRVIKGEPIE
jgi:MoxR-like ATPase